MRVSDLTFLVYLDYTAKVTYARAAYSSIGQQLRGIEGPPFSTLHPVRLCITYTEKIFTLPNDAQKFITLDITKQATTVCLLLTLPLIEGGGSLFLTVSIQLTCLFV